VINCLQVTDFLLWGRLLELVRFHAWHRLSYADADACLLLLLLQLTSRVLIAQQPAMKH
jgi:hypothetical protein